MASTPTSRDLDRLVAFVNSNDIEENRDQLATPKLLGAWLVERGEAAAIPSVDARTYARVLTLREGLRALGRANNDETPDPAQLRALAATTASLPLTASLGIGSTWQLRPEASGVDEFLAGIVATAVRAMADDSWSRVKACQNSTCRWLFIDHSRNRSRIWCTMAICGSRMKARAYRARLRTSA